jgi:hypothetical protein
MRNRMDLLAPRKAEKLARQRGAAPDIGLDGLGRGDDARIFGVALDEARAARDRHEKVIEVMRYAAGELAERVHFPVASRLCMRSSFCCASRRHWVMSRVILAKPMSSPASLRIGSMTTLAQKEPAVFADAPPFLLVSVRSSARFAARAPAC